MPYPLNRKRLLAAMPEILLAMSIPVGRETAAQAAGIPPRSFERYMARGRAARATLEDAIDAGQEPPTLSSDDAFLLGIYEQVEAKRSKAIIANALEIRQGAPNWQARAWTLERISREQYAPPVRHELSGPGGGPLETLQVVVSARNECRTELGLPPLEIVQRKAGPPDKE